MDPRELDRCIELAAGAHQRLLADLDAAVGRGDVDPGTASRLPGWTIGHVLTHIARNADSFTRMIEGAAQGEVLDQYPGGGSERRAGIEAGARRPLDVLVDDVRRSAWRLEQQWAATPDWDRPCRPMLGGEVPLSELPLRRVREVEVHHVDLALDYSFADLPVEYVRRELRRMEMLWRARQPMGLTGLPAGALAADERTRLAWLLGRAEIDGVPPAGVF
jgi:maleylpyruvate isomerase